MRPPQHHLMRIRSILCAFCYVNILPLTYGYKQRNITEQSQQTSKTHAAQYLLSLMESQPKFGPLIELIGTQINQTIGVAEQQPVQSLIKKITISDTTYNGKCIASGSNNENYPQSSGSMKYI